MESEKDILFESLNELPHKYNDISYTVEGIRAGEDVPKRNPFWVISFLPTGEKVGASLDYFMGKRDNINYNNYGYGEVELVVIRAFARDDGAVGGRELTQAWLIEMERFIKINWINLINNGSVDRGSFRPYREIYSSLQEKQFGYEMMFKVITTNWWTNEPEEGAVSPVDVEDVRVDDENFHIWVKK